MSNDFVSIRNGDAFVDKESKIMEIFNTHYINIVEKTLGLIGTNNTQEIIEGIIRKYERHPSILILLLLSLLIFAKLTLQTLTPFLKKQTLKKQLDLTLFPKN